MLLPGKYVRFIFANTNRLILGVIYGTRIRSVYRTRKAPSD